MKNSLIVLAGIIGGALLLDASCFSLWVVSGQYPSDGFYCGAGTALVLRSVL